MDKQPQILRYPTDTDFSGPLVAAIGNFDGIHIGHREILRLVKDRASKLPQARTALLSFYPHPALVLGKAQTLPQITNIRQKSGLLAELGIDYLYLFHFTKKFAAISAKEYVHEILIKKLNIAYLLIGPDARVGRAGEGDAGYILEEFSTSGRQAEIVKFVESSGYRASSRLIRDSILKSDFEKANIFLEKNFRIDGRVIKGAGRGSKIGIPTANIRIAKNQLIPANGVYLTRTTLNGNIFNSLTNIGTRPTFGPSERAIETYLLNYNGLQFYGSRIEIEFLKKIREEKKFDSVDNLIAAINSDVEYARAFFEKNGRQV